MSYIPSVNIEQGLSDDFQYVVTSNSQTVWGSIISSFNDGLHSFSIVGNYGTGKSSFIAALQRDLLKDTNTLIKQFDAEIGIPVIPYDKPERENVAESNIKQVDSCARAITWIKCLKSSNEKVKALYGDILDFELKYIDTEGGADSADNAFNTNTV